MYSFLNTRSINDSFIILLHTMCFVYLQPFNFYDDIHMNHGSDVTATSSHSSEFEEDRRLKPEVKCTYYIILLLFLLDAIHGI